MVKCPKCERSLSDLTIVPLKLKISSSQTYKGLAYTCPYCSSVVSSGPDFLAQADEISDQVVRKLQKR